MKKWFNLARYGKRNDFHSSLLMLILLDRGEAVELGIFFFSLLILCELIYVKSCLLPFEEILVRTRMNKCKVERMKIETGFFDWKFFSVTLPTLFIICNNRLRRLILPTFTSRFPSSFRKYKK